jgi:hypothetical protein
MNPYDDPPACGDCGGYLGSAGEMCACGGVSQYNQRSCEPAEDTPERRALTWEDAMRQLRERYVAPW